MSLNFDKVSITAKECGSTLISLSAPSSGGEVNPCIRSAILSGSPSCLLIRHYTPLKNTGCACVTATTMLMSVLTPLYDFFYIMFVPKSFQVL